MQEIANWPKQQTKQDKIIRLKLAPNLPTKNTLIQINNNRAHKNANKLIPSKIEIEDVGTS